MAAKKHGVGSTYMTLTPTAWAALSNAAVRSIWLETTFYERWSKSVSLSSQVSADNVVRGPATGGGGNFAAAGQATEATTQGAGGGGGRAIPSSANMSGRPPLCG